MIALLYVLSVGADIASTVYARSRGLREGNPLLRASGRFWLPARLAIAAAIVVIWMATDAPDWVLIVGSAFYFAVSVSNVIVARRAA